MDGENALLVIKVVHITVELRAMHHRRRDLISKELTTGCDVTYP